MSEEFVGWLDDEWNVVLDQSQPIVRCRDCAYYDDERGGLDAWGPKCWREISVVDIGGGKTNCAATGMWTNCREVGHCTAGVIETED